MQRIRLFVATFICSIVLSNSLVAPVSADHMTGTYIGQTNASGATLMLDQTGRNVSGTITAQSLNANFEGQSDGNDNANCKVLITQNGQNFSGSMALTLQGVSMLVNLNISGNPGLTGRYVFSRSTGQSTQPLQQQSDESKSDAAKPESPQTTTPEKDKDSPGGLPNFD